MAYHGVLPHQNYSGNAIFSSQALSNLVHLLRADIVNLDDEDRLVLLQQGLQLVEVSRLGISLSPHVFFGMKIGSLRAG